MSRIRLPWKPSQPHLMAALVGVLAAAGIVVGSTANLEPADAGADAPSPPELSAEPRSR